MSIKQIKLNDLRSYKGKEGLVLQGCGGDPKEWVDGINDLLTKEGILLDGTKFKDEDCVVFKNEDLTCILFEFNDNVKLNMGKFAMWRLATHSNLGGTWLTDYVNNRLGGFEAEPESKSQKTKCPLIGQDGNIFNLMGIASRTLRENGLGDQAKEMSSRIMASGSYDEALCIIGEYVEITSVGDEDEGFDEDYDENEDEDFDEDEDEDFSEGMEVKYE